MTDKYIFGPVASRRLGVSLGIDLVPHKTCPLNCVYCEAGATNQLVTERHEYVPVDQVISELDYYLKQHPELDFLTFSGAGEPTLNSGIGKIVEFVRSKHPEYRICLLTNGTLFNDDQVIADVREVDLAIPSLDAATEEQYQIINRPHSGLNLEMLVNGLIKFRKAFSGALWLELFVVPGINDSDESIAAFRDIITRIAPDKVQLNTLDRPGCVDWIQPAPEAVLMRFIEQLKPVVPVEAVGRFKYKSYNESSRSDNELKYRIIELVSRRPGTIADICLALAVSESEATRLTDELTKSGKLTANQAERGTFFSVA